MSGGYGYWACPSCGVAVRRSQLDEDMHECTPERFISHQIAKARRELYRLEQDLASWLSTPAGAFQAFLARRMMACRRSDTRLGYFARLNRPRVNAVAASGPSASC